MLFMFELIFIKTFTFTKPLCIGKQDEIISFYKTPIISLCMWEQTVFVLEEEISLL